MEYARPKPRPQNSWANNFDRIKWAVDKPVKLNLRHDLERERLTGSAQFNCGGCNE
jgi:hypothetical protein